MATYKKIKNIINYILIFSRSDKSIWSIKSNSVAMFEAAETGTGRHRILRAKMIR